MARLRFNGLRTTLAASLDDDDTTITFDDELLHSGGVSVPTIAGDDYLALVILADGRLVEIVHLTAYTEGDSDGTILRGQEGTTAVAHLSGAKVWNTVLADDVAHAPPVVVDSSSAEGSGSSIDITVPSDVEAGDVIVIMVFSGYNVTSITLGYPIYLAHIDWMNTFLAMRGADGTEGGDTVHIDFAGSDTQTAYCAVIRGAKAVDGYNQVYAGSADVASYPITGPARVGALLLTGACFRTTAAVTVTPNDDVIIDRSTDPYASTLVVSTAEAPLPLQTAALGAGSSKFGAVIVSLSG